MIAAAGLKIDYEATVALDANIPRILMMLAVAVARGTGIAMSDDDVDIAVADAIAKYPVEAHAILHQINFARMAQRLRAGKK